MKSLPVALALALTAVAASAQDSRSSWEYLVISQDEAVSFVADPAQQEAYKGWLSANRPDTFKKLSELEAQEASADNARKKIKSLISGVTNSHLGSLAALDYFLNVRGKEGWELLSRSDGILIFKRRAS